MGNARGFTLIELLVVVTIIGLLAAIAIPQFAVYRQRAYDATSLSDLRNVANAEEAYYALRGDYVSCTGAACGAPPLTGVKLSVGVSIDITAAPETFTGTSKHVSGATTWNWDSASGGLR